MTSDEWVAACLATAPPLSPAQAAELRLLFRAPQATAAAPAAATPGTAAVPARTGNPARSTSNAR